MIYSVSEVNHLAKQIFDANPLFQNIEVNGEVSGAKLYPSGHFYFTLKDQQATLRCVMFNSYFRQLTDKPNNGDQVTVKGGLTIYEASGQYQLIVRSLKPQGLGDLHIQFEKLKEELAKEGYFSAEHKKPIPFLPKIIGVATSQSGAVFHDIQSVLHRRFPGFKIHFIPVSVQGDNASSEIARAIRTFNHMKQVDVIIIGRGGGSIEDLWAFNERIVADAIFESKIPIISAVGHETDFTIADFVADLRAPTPSAAAELVIIEKTKLLDELAVLKDSISRKIKDQLRFLEKEFLQLTERPILKYPERFFEQYYQFLDDQNSKLRRELRYQFAEKAGNTRQLNKELKSSMDRRMTQESEWLKAQTTTLLALNPLAILERGYTYVRNADGEIISSVKRIHVGEYISLHFRDGRTDAEIKQKPEMGENL